MSIKVQKIIMFIPVINFLTVFSGYMLVIKTM